MSIYVGNLPYEVTQDDLSNLISEYGTVKRVQLPTDQKTGRLRGFGLVEMETEAAQTAAIEAIDGKEWMERELKVNKAKPREEKSRASGNWGNNSGSGGGRYSRQPY